MGDFNKDGKAGVSILGMIDLNGLPEADKARSGLGTMRRCAQRGDPGAAFHILNRIVPDISPDEEDQS